MSAAVNDAERTETVESTEPRDAGLVLGDDQYLIYDTENHRAWIQSDQACHLERTR